MPVTKTPSMRHPRRQNVTTSTDGLKKLVPYAKISPKMMDRRDIAGNAEEDMDQDSNSNNNNDGYDEDGKTIMLLIMMMMMITIMITMTI